MDAERAEDRRRGGGVRGEQPGTAGERAVRGRLQRAVRTVHAEPVDGRCGRPAMTNAETR